MKIIVTGALGHIGSALIRQMPFQFPGSEIVLIDNMMTQRFCSLFNLPAEGNYRFIEGDIEKLNLLEIFKQAHTVIHLAAITDAAGSFDKAEQVERNNLNSTKHVAESCVQAGARLITLSSTSVYGTSESLVDEACSATELKPQSPYATTKLKEEEYVQSLCDNKGLKAAVCRFGTIFGVSPGIRFHTAVNKFCWQASWGQPLTVWSTAYNQVRPYLDLIDACNAIAHIIKNDLFDGEIYNVLTLNATVRQVVDEIKNHQNEITLKMVDSAIMNQLSYEVSTNKFNATGFKYTGSLSGGIGDTMRLLKTGKKINS
jgi:nucleoside-diphosphate-sugar epimerase